MFKYFCLNISYHTDYCGRSFIDSSFEAYLIVDLESDLSANFVKLYILTFFGVVVALFDEFTE